MVAGRVGMGMSCISQGDNFTIALTTDEAICSEPRAIVDIMEDKMQSEIRAFKESKKQKWQN